MTVEAMIPPDRALPGTQQKRHSSAGWLLDGLKWFVVARAAQGCHDGHPIAFAHSRLIGNGP